MSPPLPPELLQEILALATADERPAGRQKTRLAFGSVCRSWRASSAGWKEVEVIGQVQLSRLLAKLLDSPDAAPQIRTLHIQLNGHPTPPAIRQSRTDLHALLSLTLYVRHLALTVRWGSIVDLAAAEAEDRAQWWANPPDRFGPFVEPALTALPEVEQFSLSGVSSERAVERPRVTCWCIKQLLGTWPTLKRFSISNCYIGNFDDADRLETIWPENSVVRQVHLEHFNCDPAVHICLGQLPSSVRTLSFKDWSFFTHPVQGFRVQIMSHLPAVATQLTALFLDDKATYTSREDRGGWEDLLAQMTSLRTLAIGVCAVANLPTALEPLKDLRVLELGEGYALPTVPLGHDEVLALLRKAPALRWLGLAHAVWTKWLPEEMRAVEREAERGAVRLHLRSKPKRGWPYSEMTPDSSEDEEDGDEEDEDDDDDADHGGGDEGESGDQADG